MYNEPTTKAATAKIKGTLTLIEEIEDPKESKFKKYTTMVNKEFDKLADAIFDLRNQLDPVLDSSSDRVQNEEVHTLIDSKSDFERFINDVQLKITLSTTNIREMHEKLTI